MKQLKIKTLKHNKSTVFMGMSVIIAAYLLFYFAAPLSETIMADYDLGPIGTSLIKLTIAGPLVVFWALLAYAARSVQDYAKSIEKSSESIGFKRLAYGLYFLLAGSIISSAINLALAYSPKEPDIQKIITIINNYAGALSALIAFSFVFYGSLQLAKFIKAGVEFEKYTPFVFIVVIFVGSLLVWTIIQNPNRSVSTTSGVQPTYYLNDFLIITTIATPYIVAWALGLTGLVNLSLFKMRVKGLIYKEALKNFTMGFLLVILLQIFLQFMAQSEDYFSQVGLWRTLVITYIVLAILLAAYMLVASGARKLKKIELV